ncbi:hypothetical protein ACLMJK_001383 [Lecanora helva]
MAPDRQCADAAHHAVAAAGATPADGSRSIMHGVAVSDAHDVDVPSSPAPLDAKTSASRNDASEAPEITRRDVHTASSINALPRFQKGSTKKPNLAHQAALRRSSVKGKEAIQQSAPTSKPVLVRAPSKAEMRKPPQSKPRVNTNSPQLPPPESFSIQDILASLGPEADASIDAIAEICGRSKMSLADEHGSHRPPYVQLANPENSPAESVPSMRLEPVAEATSPGPQTRSKTKRLSLANSSLSGDATASDATAATSNVTTHAPNRHANRREEHNSTDPVSSPLFSQIFSWLRGSSHDSEFSDRDHRAARVLRSMLSDAESVRS